MNVWNVAYKMRGKNEEEKKDRWVRGAQQSFTKKQTGCGKITLTNLLTERSLLPSIFSCCYLQGGHFAPVTHYSLSAFSHESVRLSQTFMAWSKSKGSQTECVFLTSNISVFISFQVYRICVLREGRKQQNLFTPTALSFPISV